MSNFFLSLFLGIIGALATMFVARPILSFFNLRAAIEAERLIVARLPSVPYRRLVRVHDGTVFDPSADARASRKRLRELADRISIFRRTEPTAMIIGLIFNLTEIQQAIESLSANIDGARRLQANDTLRKAIRVQQ